MSSLIESKTMENKTPICCKKFKELITVTEINSTDDKYFFSYHFQCNKCGEVNSIVEEQ